jgi:hypothetical protein
LPRDRAPAKSRHVPATPHPPSCNFIRYRMTGNQEVMLENRRRVRIMKRFQRVVKG